MECKHNRFKGFILCADCARFKTDQILDKINNLEDENKLLKTQLLELNQANVNLHNENEKLKKELKDKTKYVYEKTETRKAGQVSKSDVETRTYDEHLQEQQLKINELEKELKIHKQQQAFNFTSLGETVNRVIEFKEQLEVKEIINQDLLKKYQLLEEEIQAYDINMLELVESYTKLEQDYNDLSKNMLQGLQVKLQHRVKPYLGAGVVNVIIETKEDFK